MKNGTLYWAVIAESIHNPYRAVVVQDKFPSEAAAKRYILEVTRRQHDTMEAMAVEVS